jgi:ASC-1-like (ASCH) protein
MKHNLKTLPPYFDDVKSGKKNFELRRNDRDFQEGDTLILEEYNPCNELFGYTGRVVQAKVSYVLKNCSKYGLKDGYCILGLTIISQL